MKRKSLLLAIMAVAFLMMFTGCQVTPDNCNHQFTEYKLCTKCGKYNGFAYSNHNGRCPKISWTLNDYISLEFVTSDAGIYKLILGCSKSGLPHDSWDECVEDMHLYDSKGNEVSITCDEDSLRTSATELKAKQKYYLYFKYVNEPHFKPSDNPELEPFIVILEQDREAIYFWPYLIKNDK